MKKACFCGKVTMDFPEKPLLHFMCHCTDCDSLWNGAYMGFVYPTDEVTIGGEKSTYKYNVAQSDLPIHLSEEYTISSLCI